MTYMMRCGCPGVLRNLKGDIERVNEEGWEGGEDRAGGSGMSRVDWCVCRAHKGRELMISVLTKCPSKLTLY